MQVFQISSKPTNLYWPLCPEVIQIPVRYRYRTCDFFNHFPITKNCSFKKLDTPIFVSPPRMFRAGLLLVSIRTREFRILNSRINFLCIVHFTGLALASRLPKVIPTFLARADYAQSLLSFRPFPREEGEGEHACMGMNEEGMNTEKDSYTINSPIIVRTRISQYLFVPSICLCLRRKDATQQRTGGWYPYIQTPNCPLI